jgi:hypothetical protein
MRRGPFVLAVAGTGISMAALLAYRAIRPWYRRWGVETGDAERLLPGDELIATPSVSDTRGIVIDAPAAAIWPWLVQMGFGRGGWYSYDAMDMRGPSATRIVPEWQSIAVGETMPTHPGGGFEIAQVEPDHALVLYLDNTIVARQQEVAQETAVGGLGADPMPAGLAASAAIMRTQPDRFRATWSFVLDPVDGNRTRLIERVRAEYPELDRFSSLTGSVFGFGVFAMVRRQLLGIKERAERLVTTSGPVLPREEELPAVTGHQELVPA